MRSPQGTPDLLDDWRSTLVLFWFPAAGMIASGFLNVGLGWRTVIWVIALATMGAGCMANAARCGRVHCYFTGPFFLVMAVVTLLYGMNVVPLGRSGWNIISAVVIAGAVLLCCTPEMLFGKYRDKGGNK